MHERLELTSVHVDTVPFASFVSVRMKNINTIGLTLGRRLRPSSIQKGSNQGSGEVLPVKRGSYFNLHYS